MATVGKLPPTRVRFRPERVYTTGVSLDPHLHKRARARAKETRRTFSAYVSTLIAADLAAQEVAS